MQNNRFLTLILGLSKRDRRLKPDYTVFSLFFRFATKEPNGLLLYNGRFNEKHDFIAMEIINEQIQLTFSAGREVLHHGGVQKIPF